MKTQSSVGSVFFAHSSGSWFPESLEENKIPGCFPGKLDITSHVCGLGIPRRAGGRTAKSASCDTLVIVRQGAWQLTDIVARQVLFRQVCHVGRD